VSPSQRSVQVGDAAPNFELADSTGAILRMSSLRGKKAAVVYFYPKDNTSICTAEACAFRDSYEDFKELGAEVIGISSDSIETHAGFADRHHLPFILLSDPNGKVRKSFGVPKTLGLLPGRVTYVINRKGRIVYIFNSQLQAQKHVKKALEILRQSEEQ